MTEENDADRFAAHYAARYRAPGIADRLADAQRPALPGRVQGRDGRRRARLGALGARQAGAGRPAGAFERMARTPDQLTAIVTDPGALRYLPRP